MQIVELAQNLIRIPSEINNDVELKNCIDYCKNYFSKYKNLYSKEVIQNNKPSILLANCEGLDFDILSIGHIDVIPVEDMKMFNPIIKDGKMYGRGTIDMKSQVAVSMKMLEYVLDNNIQDYKFGILIVGDEESGGKYGAKHWADNLKLKSRIILDFDNGNEIDLITQKLKGVFRCKLISKGLSTHGALPWLGIDANENLMQTLINLRQYFPYISKNNPANDEWVPTVHAGIIKGGDAINTICPEAEAQLDFRTTEAYSDEEILKILKDCIVGDIEIEMLPGGKMVFTEQDNKYLKSYRAIVEKVLNRPVSYEHKNWATDSRYFVDKNTTIIPHGPTGKGLHSNNEWIDIKSLEDFEKIQIEFLKNIKDIL